MFWLALVLAAETAATVDSPSGGLEIRGETSCPTPAAVSMALTPLLPQPPATTKQLQMVLLAAQDEAIMLRLFGRGLDLLEERRLPPSASCDERARAAAVVIAAWLTHLPQTASPRIELGASSAPATNDTGPRRVVFQASAAALASLTTEGTVPGLLIEASLAPRNGAWSLSLDGLLEGTHQIAVGSGQGTWRRLGVGISGGWRWVRGRGWLEARAGALLTRLDIQGSGFTANASGVTADAGGAVGVRLGMGLGTVSPWVGSWAVGWAGTQRVYVTGAPANAEIPRGEVLLGVGATFGRRGETF